MKITTEGYEKALALGVKLEQVLYLEQALKYSGIDVSLNLNETLDLERKGL